MKLEIEGGARSFALACILVGIAVISCVQAAAARPGGWSARNALVATVASLGTLFFSYWCYKIIFILGLRVSRARMSRALGAVVWISLFGAIVSTLRFLAESTSAASATVPTLAFLSCCWAAVRACWGADPPRRGLRRSDR